MRCKRTDRIAVAPPDRQNQQTAKLALAALAYRYDPHINAQLSRAHKAEYTSFEIPTVSPEIYERIDLRMIIEPVRKRNGKKTQFSLFWYA